MFKRFRLVVDVTSGFETVKIYEKDFSTIDQVIKCATGFSANCTVAVVDRLYDRFVYCNDIIAQFREDRQDYEV